MKTQMRVATLAALFSCDKGGVLIATTRLITMHQNKGKSIADCLGDRTDYAKNPEKTNEGELVSSYECDPKTVQGEFMLSKRQYGDITGRQQASNVIAYQIRQSFKPGEITPELANKVGYELGMRFTKGNHAFIVATHTDKSHIHNHIIFNSTSLDCTKKFRDFKRSGKALAKISDLICLENGLSIIEKPKRSNGHYGNWLGDKKPLSHSDKLRQTIDTTLTQQPKTFDEFLQLMKGQAMKLNIASTALLRVQSRRNLSAYALLVTAIRKQKSKRLSRVKLYKNQPLKKQNTKKNPLICLWIYK